MSDEMPVPPLDHSPSELQGLESFESTRAAQEQAQPAASNRSKSYLRRMVRPMRADGKSHQRVRRAMYALLLLVVVLALVQAWRAQVLYTVEMESQDILLSLTEQSVANQRVARVSALLVAPAFDRDQTHRDLVAAIDKSQAAAAQFDALVRASPNLQEQAVPGLAQAHARWQAQRTVLWKLAQDVVQLPSQVEPARLGAALAHLQAELDTTQVTLDTMGELLRAHAQNQLDLLQRQTSSRYWFVLLLGIFAPLLVIEPTVRAVRRQHGALSQQAVRLKRLAVVAERSSNVVVIADVDDRVVWINDAFTQVLGYTLAQMLGKRLADVLHTSSSDPLAAKDFQQTMARGLGLKREAKVLDADGQAHWLLADLQPIYGEMGALSGWVLVAADLTEQRTQQQMLSLAVAAAGLGTWQWDIAGERLYFDERMKTIMGRDVAVADISIQEWIAQIHPDDFAAWRASVAGHMKDSSKPHRMSVRLRHASGRWIWVLFTGAAVSRGRDGRALVMAGVAMDVQAQKNLEQQLRAAARTDGLTQLPNRAVVLDMIQAAIERGRLQPGYYFAVLFMDFDRFKQVNDTLGHSVGDELLRQIAARLQHSLRPGDKMLHTSDFSQTAARIGGDEFVVLLDDIRGDLDAEIVATRLIESLAAPYLIATHKINSTVSIGIVTSGQAAGDAGSVLRDADIAMYEAKRTGRARYVMFETAMRQRLNDAVALENDLRQALEKQEISVVYQPLVSLATGRLAGLEALMRWRHPQRGMVSPAEFIPVAEACGLIGALGMYVLENSCQAFMTMQAALGELASPTVAVNLSRAQLLLPGLVAEVRNVLRSAGMNPEQLVLEVTESLAAQDELVLSTLHELRALGVALSLDDFGTGYSSLSCLHELPVNFVKIDRSFVSRAQDSAYHRVLIEATLRMAQTLGLGTVAEGIETQAQAQLMAELGCDKGQGYLYGKPMDTAALQEWMRLRG